MLGSMTPLLTKRKVPLLVFTAFERHVFNIRHTSNKKCLPKLNSILLKEGSILLKSKTAQISKKTGTTSVPKHKDEQICRREKSEVNGYIVYSR